MITTDEVTITGMKCRGCETIIEEAVNQIDGVQHVKADYRKAVVTVCFDTDKASLARIQEACTAKGYPSKSPLNTKKQRKRWSGETGQVHKW